MGLDSLIGGAISGITNLFSTQATNATNAAINNRQLQFASKEAEKQRQYELMVARMEQEYNSPVNQLKLMQEAGINPAMFGQGAGSFEPTSIGAGQMAGTPNMIPMQAPEIGDSLSKGYLNFAQAKKAEGELKTINQLRDGAVKLQNVEIDLKGAQTSLTKKEEKRISAQIDLLNAQVGEVAQTIENLKSQKDGQEILNSINRTIDAYTEKEILAKLGLLDAQSKEALARADEVRQNIKNLKALCTNIILDNGTKSYDFIFAQDTFDRRKARYQNESAILYNQALIMGYDAGVARVKSGIEGNVGYQSMSHGLQLFGDAVSIVRDGVDTYTSLRYPKANFSFGTRSRNYNQPASSR